jgi:IMP dehydrogenase
MARKQFRIPQIPLALTFDDVLLKPQASAVLPSQVALTTRLTSRLTLNLPIISSAMDTVTEHRMAIAMAQLGGLGVIHKNLSVVDQAAEVRKVKKSESGMVSAPQAIRPDATLGEARSLMHQLGISSLPVTHDGSSQGRVVGILTHRDLRFETRSHLAVREVMTSKNLVTVVDKISAAEAKKLLHQHRIEKLLVVDKRGCLKGLITVRDLEKSREYPMALKDNEGRLRVAAATGVGAEGLERAEALIAEGVDLLVVDSAHGHAQGVIDMVAQLRKRYPKLDIMGGNIATGQAARALIKAGADVLKVGVGPGSICTTRVVSGVGVPQLSALWDCLQEAHKAGVKIVSDGGIKYSGDIVKALAAGAGAVMLGSLLAGTDEALGEVILYQGRSYKSYRGMGSLGAMRLGSRDRYFQAEVVESGKLVPEGIEGRVPYKGPVAESLFQLAGGLRSGMGYLGAQDLDSLVARAEFVQITAAGFKESHVHDVDIVKEPPNYHL